MTCENVGAVWPCPYCGRAPNVHHGVHNGQYGASIECGRDDCPEPDDRPGWPYASWQQAVARWNEYAKNNR